MLGMGLESCHHSCRPFSDGISSTGPITRDECSQEGFKEEDRAMKSH